MSDMTPHKTFIVSVFRFISPLLGFLRKAGNSMYEEPFRGSYFTMLTYSASIDLITQPTTFRNPNSYFIQYFLVW